MINYVPNSLTLFRIFATPLLFWFLLGFDSFWLHLVAFLLFFLASLTDLFDGIIARKYQVVSEFGRFMDPLADKILVNGTFIILNILDIVPVWVTAVVVARDILVTTLRLQLLVQGRPLETSRFAKWKTTLQYVSMYVGLLYRLLLDWPQTKTIAAFLESWSVTHVIFALTGIVTALTGIHYFYLNSVGSKTVSAG